jgi:hypothetical protein
VENVESKTHDEQKNEKWRDGNNAKQQYKGQGPKK